MFMSYEQRLLIDSASAKRFASKLSRPAAGPRAGKAISLLWCARSTCRLAVFLYAIGIMIATQSKVIGAQVLTPQVERPLAFDSAGRLVLLAPTAAARLSLGPPAWPLGTNWTEARLYTGEAISAGATPRAAVLVATLVDGSVARYVLNADELGQLRTVINNALKVSSVATSSTRGGSTGLLRSEAAGNTFVRNQAFLGLAAYGPATAAILSKNGGAASTGGYLLAAGGSFFVAAQMVRTRSVTRAQTILATHAGLRGAAAGGAIATIADAHGGPGYGIPILIGALGGTVGGFVAARGMSDGEAASSGLAADMLALTTLGTSAAAGAFSDDSSDTAEKTALGSAVALGAIGYFVGPYYARRSAYNVTSGDANIARVGALVGAVAALAIVQPEHHERRAAGMATAGLLTGFALSDRFMVRRRDRTAADATWATLGTIAGGLMGGGVAAIAKSKSQVSIGLVAAGGLLGLIAADNTIAPAPDAGPIRPSLKTSLLPGDERVKMSLNPFGRGLSLRMTF